MKEIRILGKGLVGVFVLNFIPNLLGEGGISLRHLLINLLLKKLEKLNLI
jgi:uncharacterized membrane protein YuzA (DUF378 family)